MLKGGTTSNVLTSPSPLNPDTLNTGIIALKQQPDQAGVTLGSAPYILLVPSALFKHALEITESALVADSAINNLNVYRTAYGMKVYTSIFLDLANGGSDTAWFLLSKYHSVTRLIRQGIQTALRSWEYSNNRTYLYQANFREAVYCPDYGGIVGSTGI